MVILSVIGDSAYIFFRCTFWYCIAASLQEIGLWTDCIAASLQDIGLWTDCIAASLQEIGLWTDCIAASVTKILVKKIVSLYPIFFSKIVYLYRFKRYIFEYRCPTLMLTNLDSKRTIPVRWRKTFNKLFDEFLTAILASEHIYRNR
jgi:hypothetical protein